MTAISDFGPTLAHEKLAELHGVKVGVYSDKLSVFRVTAKEAVVGVGYTQFGRAMRDLNIYAPEREAVHPLPAAAPAI